MSNIMVQYLFQTGVMGRAVFPEGRVFDELLRFIFPLNEVTPGAAGFVRISGTELQLFTRGGISRGNTLLPSVTRAIPVDHDTWVLVPDDDDMAQETTPTFQFFEFEQGEGHAVLVPTLASVDGPLRDDEIEDFLLRSASTSLWRRSRRRKNTDVCLDTTTGDCEGDLCESGCSKQVWGPPDKPSWACYCPSA